MSARVQLYLSLGVAAVAYVGLLDALRGVERAVEEFLHPIDPDEAPEALVEPFVVDQEHTCTPPPHVVDPEALRRVESAGTL